MSQKERGFVNLAFLLIVVLVLASAVVPIKRTYNDGKSSVAGVSIAEGGSSGSDDSGSRESGDSTSNTTSGGSTTALKVSPTETPEVHQTEMETPEPKQQEKVETGKTLTTAKGEFMQADTKVQFEVQDGQVEIQTESKSGEKTHLKGEAGDEAVKQAEAELEKEGIKIATAPGQIALVDKRAGALSLLPISLDPATRQLTVTTPAGTKVVAVLPQKAIDNMLAAHVMDDVTGEKVNSSLASIPNLVKLEVENGVLGYKIDGTKTHKLLGIIPIKTGVEAFVSAENGQVVDTQESLLAKVLDRIAP